MKKEKEIEERENHKQQMRDKYNSSPYPDALLDLVYQRAYEEGHSAGYNEVEYHFDELMDFMENMFKEMGDCVKFPPKED